MKVKELVAQLQNFDQGVAVICYTEDDIFLVPGHEFRILEINDAQLREAEQMQGKDGIKSLKFVSSKSSKKHVIIDVTTDF
jgi:hypothetical protein